MNKRITIEEVSKLVEFTYTIGHGWEVKSVKGNVFGNVDGNVFGHVAGNITGNVFGNVLGSVDGSVIGNVAGDVLGDVLGDVGGEVGGTINDRPWQYVETPRQKVERLIKETGNAELLEAFNQLEDNS